MKKAVALIGILVALLALGAGTWWWLRARSAPVLVGVLTRASVGSLAGSSRVDAGTLYNEEHIGSPLRVVTVDDDWEPELTHRAILQGLQRGIRYFVSAHPSKCATAIMDLFADDSRGLLIVTASTTDQLTGKDDGILRVIPDVTWEAREMAQWVLTQGARHTLVVQDTGNLPYTEPFWSAFSAEIQQKCADCVLSHQALVLSRFKPADLSPFFEEPAELLLILAGSHQPAIGTVAQLFHSTHPKVPILLTPWAQSTDIFEASGPALGQAILPTLYPPRNTDPQMLGYFSRFSQRFGYQPVTMNVSVQQSLELLEAALRQGARSPREVKRYLIDHSPHATSLGEISFDRFGDSTATLRFVRDIRAEFSP